MFVSLLLKLASTAAWHGVYSRPMRELHVMLHGLLYCDYTIAPPSQIAEAAAYWCLGLKHLLIAK